jgi:Spy/CpxP family protein refolding chaperone
MKATLLAVAVLWLGTAIAQAPDAPPGNGPGPRQSPAERMERLTTLLDLTDSQKPQVQAIFQEEFAKMKALHDQAQASGQKPSFEQMKAAREQMHQDMIAKLTPVLTPAQLKKYEALNEEHGPGGPRRGPPGQGASPPSTPQ